MHKTLVLKSNVFLNSKSDLPPYVMVINSAHKRWFHFFRYAQSDKCVVVLIRISPEMTSSPPGNTNIRADISLQGQPNE